MTEFEQIVRSRRSIRGFSEQSVAPEQLMRIFELAQQAPSNCNTQPWQVWVASGKECDALRQAFYECASSGQAPNPDFEFKLPFENEYRTRQMDCARVLCGSLGIERGDKLARHQAMLQNYRFFEAPHVVFIGMPKQFAVNSAMDVGIYIQTLMLVMQSEGVSSCAQGALAYYPDLVRRAFNVEDNMGILVGISFGFEQVSHPANRTRTVRAPLAESVKFIG